MRKAALPPFRPALLVLLALCLALPASASALSKKEAEAILQDTFTIHGYMELDGEKDYAGKPGNVAAAALFGVFDAAMARQAEERPQPKNAPLFTVAGQALAPGELVMRDGNPGLFKGRPSKYNCFASRRAAELAALRFTGRGIKTHVAPTEGVLAGTILTDKGYFFAIDGLGDLGVEPVLKKIEPRGSGFVLTGAVEATMDGGDDGGKPAAFRLVLEPGDAPGTWKRQLSVEKAR